jgi:hypothetical protein
MVNFQLEWSDLLEPGQLNSRNSQMNSRISQMRFSEFSDETPGWNELSE